MKNKKPTSITNRAAIISAIVSAILTIILTIPNAAELIHEEIAFLQWFSFSQQFIPIGGCSSVGGAIKCWDGAVKSISIMQSLGMFLAIYSACMVIIFGVQLVVLRMHNNSLKNKK